MPDVVVVVVVVVVVIDLFFSSHELEVVDLLELGDDEFSPHVGDLHLQLVDLHVAELHAVLHVVECGFRGYKSEKRRRNVQIPCLSY